METGGSVARPSGTTPTGNPEPYDSHRSLHREHLDRPYRDGPAMATATLISPSNPYPTHPPSFPPSGPRAATSGPSIAGMISPAESRRADDNEPTHRQSLPSLSEVISGTKPTSFPPSQPPSAPGPSHSFPSPFGPGPSRSFPEPPPEKQSPRSLHPTSFGPRPEGPPPYPESSRQPPYASRPPPPPLSSFSGPQPSPPIKQEQPREPEAKAPDHGGPYQHPAHHHQPPPPGAPIYPHPHSGPLPPGQMPLPAYPVSPRHNPNVPSPYDAPRPGGHPGPHPGAHPEEGEYTAARIQYDRPISRVLDTWSYSECLQRISLSSRTISNFAEGYGRTAAEQHSSQLIPDRLPTEREVADMLANVDYIRSSLDSVRQLVQDTNERARAAGKAKGYDDDDHLYDGMKSHTYSVQEVKKRRGRAAPPGRCHSCNRIDTPEWRRGPDGARTLCNACGLHYAKLERKKQLEARQIRPRSPQRP